MIAIIIVGFVLGCLGMWLTGSYFDCFDFFDCQTGWNTVAGILYIFFGFVGYVRATSRSGLLISSAGAAIFFILAYCSTQPAYSSLIYFSFFIYLFMFYVVWSWRPKKQSLIPWDFLAAITVAIATQIGIPLLALMLWWKD
ncbi:hypothetical protein [Legionella geestiana]|uniref:hypothetical protein n=1 Tax=Legionella geestiana TaxID=45065 RepID=UPI00049157C8|nr:hypothetical protein [Legionella geestiana]QBS12864.1 hypothetical protein E4T54_08955 [Legionella geestiana]